MNSAPVRLVMASLVTVNQDSRPRRAMVSLRSLWEESLMEVWNSRAHSTRICSDAARLMSASAMPHDFVLSRPPHRIL